MVHIKLETIAMIATKWHRVLDAPSTACRSDCSLGDLHDLNSLAGGVMEREAYNTGTMAQKMTVSEACLHLSLR